MTRHRLLPALGLLLLLATALHARPVLLAGEPGSAALQEWKPDLTRFSALRWRDVGPYRGGRSAAVCGVPGQPLVYYFGSTGGGVWKSADGGQSWRNVSDGSFGGSIGSVSVSEWDPNVIYVGGGEKTVRGNVSHGEGIWKSTDAGKSWRNVGLADSRHVPRIRIHPRDPDHVWVAALGNLFGPSHQRGVFRSTDGGKNWDHVLFCGEDAGAVDLALDPTNPRILYGSTWRVRRTPWSLDSGGEGSGLWKSTDGGDTWKPLHEAAGFPAGPLGIIGITVSPSRPDNLYAIVEAPEGGLYRSRDGGESWERTSDDRELRQRAWYYSRVYSDPADEETVYVLNVEFHRSKDGGKSFTKIETPHGDNHDLWIAPDDPRRMIESNDGGANVSFDGGENWSAQSNQPTAQMYRVSTDDAFPYRLLGGQQDNSALRIRSRSFAGASIGPRDWEPTAGGESGHVVARPGESEVVFGGSYGGYLERLDHRSGERRRVDVWPDDPLGAGAESARQRFQWNFPIFFSPHDPRRLYAASNVLSMSEDDGRSWNTISPDLTRNDPAKLGPSGGPITKDNTGVEVYCTIFAALESPHEAGVLWAGSDDGLVHLSRDGGASWTNVTPGALPEWAQINCIEADPFDSSGLYLAATRYKLGDLEPYLFRTRDFGASWQRIDSGLDRSHFTRALRADPSRRGLLYAGTERGVYVSFDDGLSWQPLQTNLPIVPVTDLAVKEGDLVAATQGRGFWILDDLSPLHELGPAHLEAPAHLFHPRPAWRPAWTHGDDPRDAGANPLPGVVLTYWLKDEPAAETAFMLEILEQDGSPIRRFTREPKKGVAPEKREDELEHPDDPRQLPAGSGLQRFSWDLTYPAPERFDGLILWNDVSRGPQALPGRYQARLTVGDGTSTVEFELRADPRSSATSDELRAQHSFLRGTCDLLSRTHRTIRELRTLREDIERTSKRLPAEHAALAETAHSLVKDLTAIEETLYQTKNRSPQDPLNFPLRLDDKLAGLHQIVAAGDAPPTAQALALRDELANAIEAELTRYTSLRSGAIRDWDEALRLAGIGVLGD